MSGIGLYLDGSDLSAENVVEIAYTNEYDHIGAGLHQFVDPEDGEEYLYTHFEPYDAHRLLPCFDQPDIKASLDLTVTAPSEWEVAANYPVVSSTDAGEGRTTHVFTETPRISTYLFAFIAGPYKRYEDTWSDAAGETSLGVLCRESIAPYFDPDEFFQVTRDGLTFFSEFFDFRYPFDKYDQVFVPEFNMGAMENVGCITFSERMIFRDPPTEIQRLNRAEVVLHEMAHMWFGDLVTMRWWNDLWLNESFATYMAYLAMEHATRWSESAWSAFHARMKAWAYEQDQLPTTHPIAGEVPDTDATFLNFDGITYGKGAAVLKQLVAFLGEDGFRDGMRDYFRTHAWGNTTLADFLAALERGSGRELGRWSEAWLETAGVNTIAPQWDVAEGAVNSFTIQQTAPSEHPTLRPHRTEIAVYDRSDSGPQLRDAQPVGYRRGIDGDRGVVGGGRACGGVPQPRRSRLCQDCAGRAHAGVRAGRAGSVPGRIPAAAALAHAVGHGPRPAVLGGGLRVAGDGQAGFGADAGDCADGGLQRDACGQLVSARRDAARERAGLYDFAREQLFSASEQDFRIMWSRVMIGAAQNVEHIAEALALVDEGTGIDGLRARPGHALVAGDEGDGLQRAGRLRAARRRVGARRVGPRSESGGADSHVAADAAVKAEAWTRYQEDTEASLQMLTASMHGFWWKPQAELLEGYTDRFFDEVRSMFDKRDKEYASRFFGAMYPGQMAPSDHLIERSEALLEELGDDLVILSRPLRESLDEAKRARACRAFAATRAQT